MSIPAYSLDQLPSHQPSLWAPLAVHACRVACNASSGQSTTFEVAHVQGEQDKPRLDSFAIVHANELFDEVSWNAVTPPSEWLQIAAATVVGIYLERTTGARIQRVSRSDEGLCFYLDPQQDNEDCFLSVVGSTNSDIQEALHKAIAIAEATPCAHTIAAAVAFGSSNVTVRVLS